MYRLFMLIVLIAVSLSVSQTSTADDVLPLPGIRLPDNPRLPASIVLHDGRKVLLDRMTVSVVYDPAARTLTCQQLGQCWLINFPISRIKRPEGMSDSELAMALFGEPLAGIKNHYVRLGGEKTTDLQLASIAILPTLKHPSIIVDAAGDTGSTDESVPIVVSSIQQAVDSAKPGDIIWVRQGIYRESVNVAHGGTLDHPIVIQGEASFDGELPVVSGNDEAPKGAFKPVAGHPGLFRAENWTGKPATLTIDGKVAVERAAASQLAPGEFCLNQSSRELAFPSLANVIESHELVTDDWQHLTSDDAGFVDLNAVSGPAYLSTWLWLPPKQKAEVWDPRFPEPLTGQVEVKGPYRAGRQTNGSLSTQLNQYRLWVNGELMPASGVPNGPTPNMAYGRDGDQWQRLPFREGWNQLVVLLSQNRKRSERRFRFDYPKGFVDAISSADPPSGIQVVPSDIGRQVHSIQHWQIQELPGDDSDAMGAVYLRLPEGDRPENHSIALGNRGELMAINAPHVIVRNMEFVHGVQFQQSAQVNINAHSVVIEHCRFREPEVRCLTVNLTKWDQEDPISVVRGNVFLSPGSLAIGGVGAPRTVDRANQDGNIPGRGRMLVEYNSIRDNNRLGFKRQWESGGMKFFRLTRSVIRHNDIRGGDGPGLWLDWEHFNNRIDANFVQDVPMCAYGVEGSPGPSLICNNVAMDVREGGAWFKYAILGWSSARLWAVHNTVDSPHGLMFSEGPDDRGTQWGKLPERGAALANNLIVGRPVSVHRGRLKYLAGNRFYGPSTGGLDRYSKWSYKELQRGQIEKSNQVVGDQTPVFISRETGDLRLDRSHASDLLDAAVAKLAVNTVGVEYDILSDVKHDFFGLPRFPSDHSIPGAYRDLVHPLGRVVVEIERKDGSVARRLP